MPTPAPSHWPRCQNAEMTSSVQRESDSMCGAEFEAHTPTSLCTVRRQAVQKGKARMFPTATCHKYLFMSLPKGPNAFICHFKKGMQWLCCLAFDPGLLTSDEDEQSGEGGAEEEGVSQKPQALNRASTALPLINLSSRPMSKSQSLPKAPSHHRVDDVPMELERFSRSCLLRKI
ncbi:hypothetical protein EAF00_002091 [Botryotinia globosa]|nr:hypothetical protein EAF00_002091 [Botryotinia globosa]